MIRGELPFEIASINWQEETKCFSSSHCSKLCDGLEDGRGQTCASSRWGLEQTWTSIGCSSAKTFDRHTPGPAPSTSVQTPPQSCKVRRCFGNIIKHEGLQKDVSCLGIFAKIIRVTRESTRGTIFGG